ncbi:hypothetical protein HETIRDRAFT_164095 [Heterobasidion irregulare TC 32-1]|uniref:Uncharacterized protein n=1 Tax=Heterobasidion irregulare (strain TC 32-1) TaxID=747525 RepID=W4JX39_HETIT|nr:uncharacterized protein HETIRDRAFT_164095 [Heterobasidion irregulare TC 32-1]ETW78127.1 hypothetical protein HETIRDRAFT_164095 [Heterobasidion irregulare TC 32-1]
MLRLGRVSLPDPMYKVRYLHRIFHLLSFRVIIIALHVTEFTATQLTAAPLLTNEDTHLRMITQLYNHASPQRSTVCCRGCYPDEPMQTIRPI